MLKIIDVPENCNTISLYMDEFSDYHHQIDVESLKDYTPEPRTADGLTLREFAEIAKQDCSNVERKTANGTFTAVEKRSNLAILILDFLENPEITKTFRIKPELLHYTYPNVGAFCGCDIKIGTRLTHDEAQVTCPDCLGKLKTFHLPKLDQSVFEREDCPKWAEWAAVVGKVKYNDKEGLVCFYEKRPDFAGGLYECYQALSGKSEIVNVGKFDASDWKNSLIKRICKPLLKVSAEIERISNINI